MMAADVEYVCVCRHSLVYEEMHVNLSVCSSACIVSIVCRHVSVKHPTLSLQILVQNYREISCGNGGHQYITRLVVFQILLLLINPINGHDQKLGDHANIACFSIVKACLSSSLCAAEIVQTLH